MNKKGQREMWETTIKLILFAIVLIIAIRFCANVYNVNKGISKEHRRALSEIYQAIKHFDPQFDKVSRKILLKTNDFTIMGFNDKSYCDGSCICLCLDEYCDNAEVKPYEYCKEIEYTISEGFLIDSSDSYRRIEIKLEEDEEKKYVLTLGTKENAEE